MPRQTSGAISSFVMDELSRGSENIAELVMKRFGITRQAAGRHLRKLVRTGMIEAKGNTRARRYSAREQCLAASTISIVPGLSEDRLWRQHIEEVMTAFPSSAT